MNKKFLSAVLFGALMVTSTGTFVSCKDYDDDIDRIDKELVDIKSAISALQAKVDGGKYVTNVVKNGEGITVTWNDNSTSTIETIKGEAGKDGKDGTVVTIIDGFWAFDGVKSEYPAKGDKGDKGDQGEQGPAGGAAAGHDAKISEDGYWMVWNAEKGEYDKTTYSVAPVSAVEHNGSWTISIKNPDGKIDSIVIPAIALAHIEVINLDNRDDFNAIKMDYNYGIVRTDKKWGWKADKVMGAGLYSKLGTDMTLLLNPAGVHGDAYNYTLKNSKGAEAPVQFFEEAVPYTGAALARTVSSNALWTLPAHIEKNEASQIEVLRRNLYLYFKYNDYKYYDLAVEATHKENGAKVVSNYVSQVMLASVTGKEALDRMGSQECLIGTAYYPVFTGEAAGKIYDYELRLSQDAENLKRAAVYGATVTDNGHAWIATKEAGIYNPIKYDITYILLDGTEHQLKLTNQTLEYVTVNFTSTETSMKDPWMLEDEKLYQGTPLNATFNKNRGVFEYTTKEYDLTNHVNELSEIEKLVWNQAVDLYNKGNKSAFSVNLIGGDGENNVENNNWLVENNISYTIKDNKIRFTFSVSDQYRYNFDLNKAYQYTITVVDPDNHGAGLAQIVLPFEFTQPDIDKVGIDLQNGLFTKWVPTDNADMLFSFGAYDATMMGLPLYEAFDMWTGKAPSIYTSKNANAPYYTLSVDDSFAANKVLLVGTADPMYATLGYSDFAYFGNWTEYTTVAKNVRSNFLGAAVMANSRATLDVDVDYKFFGVYPALSSQLPFYTDANGNKKSGFRLVFASTIKESSMKMNESIYYANAGTNDIAIANTDISAKTMLEKDFVLFAGIDANGAVISRADLNKERGFNEAQRPFAQPVDYEITAKYVGNNKAVEVGPIVDLSSSSTPWVVDIDNATIKPAIDPVVNNAKIKIYNVASSQKYPVGHTTYKNGLPAYAAGYVIQLGEQIEDRQPIEITIKVKDALGFYNVLKVNVQKLQ